MPSVRARRLCPDAVFLPPDFEAYQLHSNRFREVLLVLHTARRADLARRGVPRRAAAPQPCSASRCEIADEDPRRRRSARSASRARPVWPRRSSSRSSRPTTASPNGLLHVPADETAAFLEPLPVGRLWGVGEKTADLLGRLGDPHGRRPRADAARRCSSGCSARRPREHLSELAHGVDDRVVVPYEAPKSIGHEETFERDLDDTERDPARAAAPVRAGGGTAARRRLSRADDHVEGAAGELHDALAGAHAPGRDRCRRRPVSRGRRAVSGAARGRPAGAPAGRAGVGLAGRRAPNSSRCCAASAGATSSARSIGSSSGSAKGLRPRQHCSIGRTRRVQPPEPKPHSVTRSSVPPSDRAFL